MSRSAAARAPLPIAAPRPQRAAPQIALVVSNPPRDPALSAIERTVVLLSRRDRAASESPLRRGLARLTRPLFGMRPANGLADPRLEALRRFAIALRIGNGVADPAATAAFEAAGYRRDQADAVYALCWERNARKRARPARHRQMVLAIAIWAGILPPFAVGLSDYFEDDLLGPLGAMLLFVAFAPVIAKLRPQT